MLQWLLGRYFEMVPGYLVEGGRGNQSVEAKWFFKPHDDPLHITLFVNVAIDLKCQQLWSPKSL